ncbi:MAG: GNAT family N-acetyltransferase [Clostridia bacterium]|nr:GNAT family N-acetyltransferase [Clostridia bacterium]
MKGVTIREAALTGDVLEALIALSGDWAAENSCHGYRPNAREDIEGRRVFLAEDGGRIAGYLFGKPFQSEKASSIMPDGTPCFEVEELYVVPEMRSKGVGKALMAAAEAAVKGEADFVMLSTATKNWRAILHFYIDEVGMDFWSARLFKKI